MMAVNVFENITDNILGNNIKSDKLKICRLCIGGEGKHDIFADGMLILNMIRSCSSLEIIQNDGLPNQICNECMNTLNIAISFRYRCEESDRILRSKISSLPYSPATQIDCKNEPESDSEMGLIRYLTLDYTTQNTAVQNHSVVQENKSIPPKKVNKTKRRQIIRINTQNNLTSLDGKQIKTRKKRNTMFKSQICPVCGKFFASRALLTSHLRRHSDLKPHACETCNKSFREKAQLKEHSFVHLTVREFPCEVCGKTFKSKNDVRRHNLIVHKRARKVECEICGKVAATNYGLKSHMITHTGLKTFECHICTEKFSFKNSLTQHIRTHTGEKPFSCKYCDGRFSMLRTLKDHERLHTGEKPYKCPTCTKSFSQLSNLKSHFKNNHRDLDFFTEYKGPRRHTKI